MQGRNTIVHLVIDRQSITIHASTVTFSLSRFTDLLAPFRIVRRFDFFLDIILFLLCKNYVRGKAKMFYNGSVCYEN